MDFVIGQRWLSQTEPQLGLGMVVEISVRHVTLRFPAAEESRTYAKQSAPLSRVHFQVGDKVRLQDGKEVVITQVHEHNGLLVYLGLIGSEEQTQFTEMDLDGAVHLSTPSDRLFGGQYDKKQAFELRVAALHHLNELQTSPVKGLIGARTSHLPHQVYIASEVARRYAPRVLLADEVGLGKTIEAGLITHCQLHTGRASRVLVVVPETLVHQWLVEMLRRFNLRFSVFDRERFHSIRDEGDGINPFETAQLVLCSQEFLVSAREAFAQALAAEWDLLIVDEAHHLHWHQKEDGTIEQSREYECVTGLAGKSKGLLLLTATPEQAGVASHFARLRLLDPHRFFDLDRFREEEKGYQRLNEVVTALETQHGLTDEQKSVLAGYLDGPIPEDAELATPEGQEKLIRLLLDRHGTGRVLFRNTRKAIQGFPRRVLHPAPLPLPAVYQREDCCFGVSALTPEAVSGDDDWVKTDPRVEWLKALLKAHKREKVLVICARAETAITLEHYLSVFQGVRGAAFHEGLSLIERDRAAAYFADEEFGAQVLICSEIGSEGRNFQFSHHLVLFDLPLNPDLLEQRIGRLDRIGQTEDIRIHAPYFEGSAQEILFAWYHQGLGLFERSNAAAFSIYERFRSELLEWLSRTEALASPDFTGFLEQVRACTESVLEAQESGRDKLLERHSCDREKAGVLIEQIEARENNGVALKFMEHMFDVYGVDCEEHSEHARILTPTTHMRGGFFPGLADDPVTVTFDRQQALAREDLQFLSWEHPMVTESIDMLLSSELGNACVTTISLKALPPGALLLEGVFTVVAVAPRHLQVENYLPVTPIRLLIDINGKDLSALISHEKLNELTSNVKRNIGQQVLKQVREPLEQLLEQIRPLAEARLPEVRTLASTRMKTELMVEIERMESLAKVNPSVRDEEIAFFHEQLEQGLIAIEQATLHMAALRLVVNA